MQQDLESSTGSTGLDASHSSKVHKKYQMSNKEVVNKTPFLLSWTSGKLKTGKPSQRLEPPKLINYVGKSDSILIAKPGVWSDC